jgi:hypothetical protein
VSGALSVLSRIVIDPSLKAAGPAFEALRVVSATRNRNVEPPDGW